MKLSGLVAIVVIKMAIVLPVVGFCFDYCLQNVFGKDIPWYGDAIAGLFASPIAVPGTIVLWVLKLCGVAMPLIG